MLIRESLKEGGDFVDGRPHSLARKELDETVMKPFQASRILFGFEQYSKERIEQWFSSKIIDISENTLAREEL